MDTDPVIIQPSVPLPTPLVYNDTINTTNMTNILLIDSIVYDKQVFYDSANTNTFPIIYDSTSKTDDLISLLRQKFTSSIQRISFVFHDRGPNIQAPFMNNKIFFEDSDLEVNQTSFSENVSFLISCIKEFHVEHIDYLACNTLQYSNWKSYYALLASETPVVVGASSDATGNMQYGGDWVMESTSEDVMQIYFNANISSYVSLLASTITQNGGYIYLRMDPSGQFVQSSSDGLAWTSIIAASWPITITNSPSPSAGNILRVVLTTDISMSTTYTGGTNSYLIAGSQYVTFDGSSNYVRVNGITSYLGFIRNGTSGANGQANVVVQNFKTNISGGATLNLYAGWLCQSYFGRGVSGNSITNCTNYGDVGIGGGTYGSGGIVGSVAGYGNGTLTISYCTNYGLVHGDAGGSPSDVGSGGIVGNDIGYFNTSGTITISYCTNYGEIDGNECGGIAGSEAASNCSGSSVVQFIGCTNNGRMNGDTVGATRIGGIAGLWAGYFNSSTAGLTFTDCVNTGDIKVFNGGGIAGGQTGYSGKVIFTRCFNTGYIYTAYAGGIVGGFFSRTNGQGSIVSCYNIANVGGSNCGGITGADLGGSLPSSSIINISNCYSVGDIASSCGGIVGGWSGNNLGTPTVNIQNCYSSGVLIGTGQGLVAIGYATASNPPFTNPTINISSSYIADGSWTDASANASLTGEPTSADTPGVTWTTLGTNIPYVLSAYTAQLYNPSTGSTTSSYRTTPGLFQPDFTYRKFKATQVSNVLTTLAFTSKGTSPYYYSYNCNSFALTNSNSNGATTTMTSTINTLDGVIDINVPAPTGPITITANGSTQSVYLRMNGTLIEYGLTLTGPWSLIAINANWPVTIVNSNPGSSSILNVIFLENLTISNTYGNTSGYFVVGTQYITFNGENYNLNINNITGYGGFIQNGTSSSNGLSNISVTNIITNVNSSTLSTNSGWICRTYFGSGPSSGGVLCLNNSVVNCTNNGNINVKYAGGIAGSYSGKNGKLSFTNCINTGTISGESAGGIVGQYAGLCDTSANTLLTFTNCVNNGTISGVGSGGIAGMNIGNGKYPAAGSTFIYQAITIFTNCSNNGNITGDYSGGIAGQYVGYNTGDKLITDLSYAMSFINCNNTGSINALDAGGIAGQYAGGANGGGASIYFENCTNTGNISVNSDGAGGIVGSRVGSQAGSLGGTYKSVFYNCTNSGDINAINSGGIAGCFASNYGGGYGAIFINCFNSGSVNGDNAGGIVGASAGAWFGRAQLNNCYSNGIISGLYAGGLAGYMFGTNSPGISSLSNCYSTGNITGKEAGGIVGGDVGYIFGSGTFPVVDISNCYSLGTISGVQAGGIVGGSAGLPWHATNYQTINIKNCYSYGTISNGSAGILSPGYDKPARVFITNCYIANGNWTDASANASLIPGTTPTNLTTNNPGSVWTTLSTSFIPRVPYVLSSFNAQLYSPTSASSASNYSTTPGLIQPNFNYSIVYTTQPSNTINTRVFSSKGTSPYYYAYNFNTFAFTNTSLTSGTIYVAVAPSTGVLNFTLPIINQPIVTQIPNPFTPYASSPNNLGEVIYTDASYAIIPNIATNPTYILSTNITDNTFDVFQNSATIPAAFIPNSLFINNNLISPSGIVKDSVGNFYVGNSTYNVISVYDTNGLYLRSISVYSSINIPLNSINYIAIDSSNNLYITSDSNSGVYVVPSGSNENNLTSTILKYSYGNDFRGIACNANYLYIVVKRSSPAYIVKYNLTDKKYLQLNLSGTITSGEPVAIMYNNINPSLPPFYITTIDGSNNIYTISNITGTETLIGGIGSATITFLTTFPNNLYPYSLTMDNSANLYVGLDEGRIQPVNVNSIGKIARVTPTGVISNTSYLTYNGLGIGRPEGLLFEGSLYLYVTDILHNRVIKSRPKTFTFGPAILNADAFYVKDPLNPTQYKTYLYNITNSIIDTTFNLAADCFQKGTKILCENDIYVLIENIKVGDLVKTYKHGYQKVMKCVTRRSCDYVSNSRNQIYMYTQKSNPELIEDLYLTGGHSLLLDALSESETNDMKQADWLDSDFMVEDKYKLMCCFNKKLDVAANQNVELYRIALEPPENATPTHVYGIWANGILSESSSKASMDK